METGSALRERIWQNLKLHDTFRGCCSIPFADSLNSQRLTSTLSPAKRFAAMLRQFRVHQCLAGTRYDLSQVREFCSSLLEFHADCSADGRPVLSHRGVTLLKQLIEPAEKAAQPDVPVWDVELRQLRLGDHILKEFHRPAPAQFAILEMFQERGWPMGVQSMPLRSGHEADREKLKQFNRDAIKNLNRGLPRGTIMFHGDGTGFGVRLELLVKQWH